MFKFLPFFGCKIIFLPNFGQLQLPKLGKNIQQTHQKSVSRLVVKSDDKTPCTLSHTYSVYSTLPKLLAHFLYFCHTLSGFGILLHLLVFCVARAKNFEAECKSLLHFFSGREGRAGGRGGAGGCKSISAAVKKVERDI